MGTVHSFGKYKNRERDGTLIFDGCERIGGHNNQLRVGRRDGGIGRGDANGRYEWGGHLLIIFGGKLEGKNREKDVALIFYGFCWMEGHNNQPKFSLSNRIQLGESERR